MSKPKMNLQSKFTYCIITQTLNIALCLQAGQNHGLVDKQTIQLLDTSILADLPCRGINDILVKLYECFIPEVV